MAKESPTTWKQETAPSHAATMDSEQGLSVSQHLWGGGEGMGTGLVGVRHWEALQVGRGCSWSTLPSLGS